MVRPKEAGILQGVVAYSAIMTGDGLKVTLRRLELVMPFMRKCGECTLALDLAWKKQISHFTGF
jgi:hypothetical protein